MKRLLLSLLLFFATPAVAADTPSSVVPTTANKIEGPVTGKLPDKIDLQLQSYDHVPVLDGLDTFNVSFCTTAFSPQSHRVNNQFLINGAHTICQTPDRMLHIAGQRQPTGITIFA